MRLSRSALAVLALALLGPALLVAQEPLAAGSDGVPVPKKKKHVQPVYPPDALAQGIRGIVILDLTIDTEGQVAETTIIRSIPGLDEAALAAVLQWTYNPVKVDGKPVSVRLTVPITFALKLPKLSRQPGIPALRQGVTPPWPGTAVGGGEAVADITLEPDGRIGLARIIEGEDPWSTALLQALRTWRFTAPPDDATVSFQVVAEFVPGRGRGKEGSVRLDLRSLRETALFDAPGDFEGEEPVSTAQLVPVPEPPAPDPPAVPPEPEPAPQEATPPALETGAETAEEVAPEPAPATPAAPVEPAAPPPAAPSGAQADSTPASTAAEVPPAGTPPSALPAAAPPAASPSSPGAPPASPPEGLALARPASAPPGAAESQSAAGAPSAAGPDPTAPPPVETLSVAPPPLPPENGISAIRGVELEPGVPDLIRGRRPVSPPLARMVGAGGLVEVEFSVSAGGIPTIQRTDGPEVLLPAASSGVESWVFRRTRADRAYLVAVFTYEDDLATVVVRPQPSR